MPPEEQKIWEKKQQRGGFAFLKRLKEIVVGAGNILFKASKDGIWLGDANFENAPFRVSMKGNLTTEVIKIGALYWNRRVILPSFESLDGWITSLGGTNAAIIIRVGSMNLRSGNAVDNLTYALLDSNNSYITVAGTKDPFFQTNYQQGSGAGDDGDFGLACGLTNPFAAATGYAFGFKYVKADVKLYCFHHHQVAGSWVEVKDEITGITITSDNVYRAELYYDATKPAGQRHTLKFYINSVLKKTYSDIDCSLDDDDIFSACVRTAVVPPEGYGHEGWISNLIFSQKY